MDTDQITRLHRPELESLCRDLLTLATHADAPPWLRGQAEALIGQAEAASEVRRGREYAAALAEALR